MKKLIIAEQIEKTFGLKEERHMVLDHVSLTIDQGEFVAIMGPSGSGKSTLLYALSGIDGVDHGRILMDGIDLTNYKENQLADLRRGQMGFVFQQPTMLKNLNVLDNIVLPCLRDHHKEVKTITRKAKQLMQNMGILELEKRDITQVSGGQLQRAGICRALMNDPKIIFADEPTGALNSKSANEVMDIFESIHQEGTAILLVSHDAKVAARSKRILFMQDGKVMDELKLGSYHPHDLDDRIHQVTTKMLELGI